MRRYRNFIIIGLVFLFICVLGVGVAAAAEGSRPGDPMFGVKLQIEQLRASLSRDDVLRARLRLEFLETRLNEFEQLSGRHKPRTLCRKSSGR